MSFDGIVSMLHAGVLVLAIGAFFVAAWLLVEVIAGLPGVRRSRSASAPTPSLSSFVVVVPAHNEVGTIEATLTSLVPEVGAHGRILVVADNCTDTTANVCRAAGVEVIERHDQSRRGKGYALGFAMRHLIDAPPDVIVILDADCIPEQGTIRQLVERCQSVQRPLQARYELVHSDRGGSTMARVGLLAWRVKNVLRPTGLANMGLPCLLMGTGMAFPWVALAKCDLETGHLVEDMVLGLELTDAGYPPRFAQDLCVRSTLPPSVEGQTSQRARWETGHLQVISKLVPRFFARGLTHGNAPLAMLALHAAVPPLALLALVLIGLLIASGLLVYAGGATAAFGTALAASLLAALTLLLAWHKMGRDLLSKRDLIQLPFYVLSKLSIYSGALLGRQLHWIRSRRD